MPRVCVLLPARDAAATVGGAVRTILRQTLRDLLPRRLSTTASTDGTAGPSWRAWPSATGAWRWCAGRARAHRARTPAWARGAATPRWWRAWTRATPAPTAGNTVAALAAEAAGGGGAAAPTLPRSGGRDGMRRYVGWLNGLVTAGARPARPPRRGAARPPGDGAPARGALPARRLARRPRSRKTTTSGSAPAAAGGRMTNLAGAAPPLARGRFARHPEGPALRARPPRRAEVRPPQVGRARRPGRGGALGRRRDRQDLLRRARGGGRPHRVLPSRWTRRRWAGPSGGARGPRVRRGAARAWAAPPRGGGRPRRETPHPGRARRRASTSWSTWCVS